MDPANHSGSQRSGQVEKNDARRAWLRWAAALLLIGVVVTGGAAAWKYWKSPTAPARLATPDSPLDELMGTYRRQQFEQVLCQRRYGGRSWQWEDFVRWGRELVHTGQVTKPPVGPAPSEPLAETYRCIHCHNLVREDVVLTQQDPEAREALLAHNPARHEKSAHDPAQSGKTQNESDQVALKPGTTFWGLVNRERFYNGYYARYHRLKVRVLDQNAKEPNQQSALFRPMNPASLADAVQVCCSYCSAGRFPEDWELDSLLAYLWTLELRLKDLQLPAELQKRLLEKLNSGQADQIAEGRQELRKHYLVAASATAVEPPVRSEENRDIYPPSVAALEQLFRPLGKSGSVSPNQSANSAPKTIGPGSTPPKSGSDPTTNNSHKNSAVRLTIRNHLEVTGDPQRGKWLYQSACANCHGSGVHSKAGRSLAVSPGTYHRYVWRGTERDGLYMPLFTRERLSPRQATDIRTYLRSLPK